MLELVAVETGFVVRQTHLFVLVSIAPKNGNSVPDYVTETKSVSERDPPTNTVELDYAIAVILLFYVWFLQPIIFGN